MVRLKENKELSLIVILSRFNSKMVRLKVSLFAPAEGRYASFNSKMVRLKESFTSGAYREDGGFNSKMVRLKVLLFYLN